MNKTRAFINYKTTDKPWGGSNSFLSALIEYFKKAEHIDLIFNNKHDFDLMLLNTSVTAPGRYTSLKKIKRFSECGYSSLFQYLLRGFKKRKIKIILRLDGLKKFYSEYSNIKGDFIQLNLINFADAIIFQSQESLKQFRATKGQIPVPYFIIYNGVNQEIFNLKNKQFWNRKDKLTIFTTSWSTNLRKGFADIAALSLLKNVIVNFIGNWPEGVSKENVNIKPPMSQSLLAEEYKKNDIYFFPSRNEACPNVIYEALSCGLPVIYHPSGGTAEISSPYGMPVTGDISDDIRKISENYDSLLERIRKDHHTFSIDYAGSKYAEVFQEVLSGPLVHPESTELIK